MLERAYEHGHLGNESAESRKPQRRQPGDYEADAQKRHHLHQTAHLADIPRVGTSVNHPDQRKEQSRHQAVRQHLQHGAGHRGLVQHQDREQHQSAVADRRVGVDVFQVGLLDCRERSVDHADTGQRQENPCQFVGRLGHQEDRHAKTTISAELHQHPRMQHRNGRRRRSVTVRRPRVEREHRAEHSETDERQREEQVLRAHRNRMFGDFENIHRQLTAFGRRMKIDAEDADQQQRRTSHQHQRQFHRRILFPAGSPHADQQVHRDQRHLVKHEHREQINRNEESEHPDRQQREPCEKLPR